jgi:hypothetical protein
VGALTDRQPGVDSTRLFGRCSTTTQWSGQQAIAQFETPTHARAYTEGMSFEAFARDSRTIQAVAYNLVISR